MNMSNILYYRDVFHILKPSSASMLVQEWS